MVRKPAHSCQLPVSCRATLVGHLRVLFCFGWHGILSSFLVLYKSRAARWPPCGSKQCVIHQNPGTAPARQTRRRSWRAAWRGYCRSGPAARPRPPASGPRISVRASMAPWRGAGVVDAQQVGFLKSQSVHIRSPFRALFGRCLFMFGVWAGFSAAPQRTSVFPATPVGAAAAGRC